MAHIDDLTLVTAAQLADTDVTYVGRPGDPDPDRRTTIANLATKLVGAEGPDLITRVNNLEGLFTSGSFEPKLTATGTNPTVTYSTRYGEWIRIGDLIVFDLFIGTTARTGGTGEIRISNLPFTFPRTLPLPLRQNTITYAGQLIARGISGGPVITLDSIASGAGPTALAIAAWPASAAVHVAGAFRVT